MMTPIVSKLAVITNRSLGWITYLKNTYAIDLIQFSENVFSLVESETYHILLIDDASPTDEITNLISYVNTTQQLVSIVILTEKTDPEYSLDLIESGAVDVFNINEDHAYLLRRLKLVLQQNEAKRLNIRQNRHLNSVSVLSRKLHNNSNPNTLIVEALDIVSTTFNLMGLAVILERGNQFHLRAGTSSEKTQRRVYDVMIHLEQYNPIYQVIDQNIIMVFEDISTHPYMVEIPIFTKLHSAIVLPLMYGNITLGALLVLAEEDDPLTRDDIVIYEHLATHIGSAYQNAHHTYTQNVSAQTSRHLLKTWQELSKLYQSEGVDNIILELVSSVSNIKNSLVWLYSDTSDKLTISASNQQTHTVFEQLHAAGTIENYLNQFDIQLRPIIVWLGPSHNRSLGDLFQAMGGRQLIFVPIKDEARLLGCIIVSSNSSEELHNEQISLLEGIAHAAGQTIERNLILSHKEQQASHLEAITNSIHDGVFFVTEWQDVVFCNPQFSELTGINPSQILYQPIQSLINEIVWVSSEPNLVEQQLQDAIQHMQKDSLDQDYPIVEIEIPSRSARLYIEFINFNREHGQRQKSWVGVIRDSYHIKSEGYGIDPGTIDPIFNLIQNTTEDIYAQLMTLNEANWTTRQFEVINNVKKKSREIEELLNNIESIEKLKDIDSLDLAMQQADQLLSVILNKPPLVYHQSRFKIETQPIQVLVNRQYIMETFSNLIEVALELSDKETPIHIQMGTQANSLIFRVISQAIDLSPEIIEQALNEPDIYNDALPYFVQLQLHLCQTVITKHDGKLLIKKAPHQGVHFNVIIPNGVEIMPQKTTIESEKNGAPNRKMSTVMIFDKKAYEDSIDYDYLASNNYELIYCAELSQVYYEIEMIRIDLIILTIREKDDSIIDFVERLRKQKNVKTPILILSIYNTEEIRIRALGAGVDAYISLPISNAELLAHVEALFNRAKLPERVHEPLTIDKLHVNFAQRQVTLDGKYIDLTRIEYELLCQLALKIGQTLSHQELLTEVWGPEYREEKQYLWVNMSRLRRKLEKSKNGARYIHTQPGVGYFMKEPYSKN